MIFDNELIKNRPNELLKNEFYTELPKIPIQFDYGSLPSFLNVDLLQLFGIAPKTMDLIENTQRGFYINPSKKEVEYYKKKETKFQIINVVANIHTFKKDGDEVIAYPYSISLIAGPKRGKPDECSIEFLDRINLEEIDFSSNCYTDYSPFKELSEGFYAPIGMFSNSKSYTDTIGFILESFFLPTDIELDKALINGPQNLNNNIREKYDKYRVKRYFKPFTDIKPRRIWGCDSPIELFLIQGLAQKGLFPTIQTLIFENGEIHDNFFHMIENNVFIKGDELITDVDLYFAKEKLAVFCDSTKFHRGTKAKEKDIRISEKLAELGIKSLRLQGEEIVKDLNSSVEKILNELKNNI
ncbi:DUF559 domain-containing protein [Flavobacterium anhuiense]|uniref:DUF559 domain-containing protein n=1 Tax=Flavobacterium anhuiense TaxID=459526 RepID=UPI003D956DB7